MKERESDDDAFACTKVFLLQRRLLRPKQNLQRGDQGPSAVLPFTSLSEQLPLIVLRKCLRSICLKARTFVIQCKVAPKDFAGEKRYVF